MSLNSDYKKKHKPLKEGVGRYHQGYYVPKLHPEKCVTLGENVYRSDWERRLMDWFDRSPSVVRWGSEPISVPYLNPIANFNYCVSHGLDPKNPRYWKKMNYNIDFWAEMVDTNNVVTKYFIEVKPYAQTIEPKAPKDGAKVADYKKYNEQMKTYLVNQQKWLAMEQFCEEHGCKFMKVTEHTLKKLGLL